MNYYTYSRVSTDKQSNENQQVAISRYLKANDITPIEQVEDNCSGTVPYLQRNLGTLIKKAKRGDIIIASEQSRFSRVDREFTRLTWECEDKGITLYCIKEDLAIGKSNDLGGKLRAFLNSNESESERSKVSFRTSNALQQRRDEIAQKGYFITAKGEKCTKLGNTKNLRSAQEKGNAVSAKRRAEKLMNDPRMKQAYGVIKLLKAQGETNRYIADYLESHGFTTQTGKPFLPSSLCQFMRRCRKVGF